MWGAIEKKPDRENQLLSFEFRNIPGLQDASIDFTSPITAICGVNGTGKSSILRGLWATIDPDQALAIPEILERLRDARSRAVLRVGKERATFELPRSSEASGDPSIAVLHLDPATIAIQLQRRACEISGLEDVLEALTPSVLEAKEVANLSSVLRKQYEHIKIYEIEDYDDEDPMPFVLAREYGRDYDIRTMSLGEISVFVMYWRLTRVTRNSIVLLEEPETFLSPVSQGALLDYFAMNCVKKQLSIVLTTHSPQMFARLYPPQIKFVYRAAQGAMVAGEHSYNEMRKAVGIEPIFDRILLVEDRMAREFTLSILKKLDRSILLRTEVVDVGGYAQITRISGALPERITFFRAVGVYDGDVEGTVVDPRPHIFLPGGAIEVAFRGLFDTNLESLAARLGREAEQLAVVIAELSGADHHDWFEDLGKRLNTTYSEMMHVCFDEWCALPDNKVAAEQFLSRLAELIN
jgi:predicted ATPase